MALKTSQTHPLQQLQDITFRNGTFVRTPKDTDTRLLIWGEPNQVAETKTALSSWEQDVRERLAKPRSAAWAKFRALDGRLEHRAERANQQKALTQLLQEPTVEFPVEAALLWPKEPDLEQFHSLHLEVVEQLQSQFTCRISFEDSEVQHIMIAANSDKDAIQVMTRMLNLVKETISRRNQLLTANLVHLPNFDIFRDRVGLQDKDPHSNSYLPTLHGSPAASEADWASNRRVTHLRNRKKTKKTIDAAIERLRISQQHVRMRVVFGELGFTLFQKPADGGDTYSFEEFYAMVTKGRTRLILNGLPVRQGDITDLADILDSLEAFWDRIEYYGAFFDFQSTASAQTILRLETVIFPVGDKDFEIREQRWVEIGDTVSRLQVSLFNFERPDYQVTMDAFPLHSNRSINSHMAAFQANVSFQRPANGMKSLPRRKVKFPGGQEGLRNVSELAVVRWRFKSTDGFFELRRKDVFDERPGTKNLGPIDTRWHALYYYPEWDNLMGEFAHVTPGENIGWEKSVATFFPESANQDGPALPKGFKNFINEVEEIQDILAEAIGKLAKGKQKATDLNGDAEHEGQQNGF